MLLNYNTNHFHITDNIMTTHIFDIVCRFIYSYILFFFFLSNNKNKTTPVYVCSYDLAYMYKKEDVLIR